MIRRHAPAPRRGFTVLEVVVVLSLIAILTGVLTPSVGVMLTSRAKRATIDEQAELARAAAEYFRDTGTLPANLTELQTSTLPGWVGPYLLGVPDDTISGGSGYSVDAWSRAYRITRTADTWEVRSAGKDGVQGTADDLAHAIDVTPVRREVTLERLEAINTAVTVWNGQFLVTDPLPANWTQIYTKLIAAGYLPAGAGYDVDGWGDAFEPDPPGTLPVVHVHSVHF